MLWTKNGRHLENLIVGLCGFITCGLLTTLAVKYHLYEEKNPPKGSTFFFSTTQFYAFYRFTCLSLSIINFLLYLYMIAFIEFVQWIDEFIWRTYHILFSLLIAFVIVNDHLTSAVLSRNDKDGDFKSYLPFFVAYCFATLLYLVAYVVVNPKKVVPSENRNGGQQQGQQQQQQEQQQQEQQQQEQQQEQQEQQQLELQQQQQEQQQQQQQQQEPQQQRQWYDMGIQAD